MSASLLPQPGTLPAFEPQRQKPIMRRLHCYDYQACETPDYPESWAAAVMRQIREAAILHLPGYDEAPWGYDAIITPDPR